MEDADIHIEIAQKKIRIGIILPLMKIYSLAYSMLSGIKLQLMVFNSGTFLTELIGQFHGARRT